MTALHRGGTTEVAAHITATHLSEFTGDRAPDPVAYDIDWAGPLELPLADEPAVQAACGIMHVHGRSAGRPRRLGIDYASTLAGVLAAHGVLAASVAHARGAARTFVRTSVAQAALFAVGQYLAVSTTDDDWAERWQPGSRPPFTSRDGFRFELESLRPEGWQQFWQLLDAPSSAIAEGWWPFQQRFATAAGHLPEALHAIVREVDYRTVVEAAGKAGSSVVPVRNDPKHPVDVPACTLQPLAGAALRRAERTGPAPLSGVVVVESTRRIQGPVAGHLLHALGAEVIRVEPPGGDPMRGVPPMSGACSARFRALNDGKRVVEADLKTRAGQRDVRELVSEADAFVHNWAPGKAEQFGLDAETLARVRPGLVHSWASGWAPLDWPDPPLGTDYLIQAHSGLAAAVQPQHEPSAPSLMTLTDILGGAVCTTGVLAGLLQRERTGRGSRVDSSLYSAAGMIPRSASRPVWSALDEPLPTADGFVMLPAGTGREQLCGPLDTSSTISPEELAARFSTAPTGFWTTRLAEAGVRAVPVCTNLRDLAHDPRFDAALDRVEHCYPRFPWEFT